MFWRLLSKDGFSSFFCGLVFTGWYWWYPLPWGGLLESRVWRDSPARSLRNKGLEIKSLFFFDLEVLPLPVAAPGWPLLLSTDVGPPFRPIKKSSLTRTRPPEGIFPRMQCARHDKRYATSGIAATSRKAREVGHPHLLHCQHCENRRAILTRLRRWPPARPLLEKHEKGRTPVLFFVSGWQRPL
jgi:hypothetical protein